MSHTRRIRLTIGVIKGLRIPFLVQGPTSNPQFVPDVSRLVMQTLEEQLGTKP